MRVVPEEIEADEAPGGSRDAQTERQKSQSNLNRIPAI